MAYLLVASAIFFGIMAALRWVAVYTVGNFGVIGGLVLIIAILGLSFWWERRFPTPPEPSISPDVDRQRRILENATMFVYVIFGLMLFLLLFALPRAWFWWWFIPLAAPYVRAHWVILRREKRLLAGVDSPIANIAWRAESLNFSECTEFMSAIKHPVP